MEQARRNIYWHRYTVPVDIQSPKRFSQDLLFYCTIYKLVYPTRHLYIYYNCLAQIARQAKTNIAGLIKDAMLGIRVPAINGFICQIPIVFWKLHVVYHSGYDSYDFIEGGCEEAES